MPPAALLGNRDAEYRHGSVLAQRKCFWQGRRMLNARVNSQLSFALSITAAVLVLADSPLAHAGSTVAFDNAMLLWLPTTIVFIIGNIILQRRMRSQPEAALGAICLFWAVLQVCVLVYVVGDRWIIISPGGL